jgi:hypothetical protein
MLPFMYATGLNKLKNFIVILTELDCHILFIWGWNIIENSKIICKIF